LGLFKQTVRKQDASNLRLRQNSVKENKVFCGQSYASVAQIKAVRFLIAVTQYTILSIYYLQLTRGDRVERLLHVDHDKQKS